MFRPAVSHAALAVGEDIPRHRIDVGLRARTGSSVAAKTLSAAVMPEPMLNETADGVGREVSDSLWPAVDSSRLRPVGRMLLR